MSSVQEFKCVFCEDKFNSKDELQIHFRKHGDPNFGQNKGTSSVENKEENEMVNCDVCAEVFTTISKAITHKHKIHPDHDAKYFCPLCGKLFTMKHLFNKHMRSVHPEDEREKFSFPCHSCDVEFFLASAMLYHNKFFHRQDTELPNIGHSKKVQTFGGEMVLLYYCPFCGDEYNNKMNLHKHMVEDHYDENQHPEDILRCPLCDAIFYHLDAYELHLTFHSVDDLYNEKNDIITQITEFSLEAVPPLMEKIENIPEENSLDPIELADMLQMGMDDPGDSGPEKKKRKKHKKSKKSAITLDEFLNMNQDVFGEGLDVQGIIEVPTQVVTNTLKRKQPVVTPGSKMSSADLQKLKKQGVTIKMKPKPLQQRIKTKPQPNANKPVKPVNSSNNIKVRSPASPNKDCNAVIAKLMGQSNSQIKIVKKTSTNNQNEETNIKDSPKEDQKDVPDLPEDVRKSETSEIVINSGNGNTNEEKVELEKPILKHLNESTNVKEKTNTPEKSDVNSSLDMLRKISQHLTVKAVSQSPRGKSERKELTGEHPEIETDDIHDNKKNLDDAKHNVLKENLSDPEINDNALHDDENKQESLIKNKDKNSVIDLKNLNKSVTVKPVFPQTGKDEPKNTPCDIDDDQLREEEMIPDEDMIQNEEDMPLSETNAMKKISPISKSKTQAGPSNLDHDLADNEINKNNENVDNDDNEPLSALKNISKFVTVKQVSTKICKNNIELDANTEKHPNNSQIKNNSYSRKKTLSLENFNDDSNDHEMSEEEFDNSPIKDDKEDNHRPSPIPKLKTNYSKEQGADSFSDDDTEEKISKIKNVGSKPLESIKRLNTHISIKQSSSDSSKPVMENKLPKCDNDFNKTVTCKTQQNKTDSSGHLEALKKLGSNITLKSNKVIASNINIINEEVNEDIACQIKETPSHVEALKKLGSNITLKSNNTASNNPGAINKYKTNISTPKSSVTNKLIHNQQSMSKSITNRSVSNHMNKVNTSTVTLNQSVSAKSLTSNFSQKTSCSTFSSKKEKSLHKVTGKSEVFNIEDSDDENISDLQEKPQSTSLDKTVAVKNFNKNRPGPACSKKGFFKNIEKEIEAEMSRAQKEMQNSLKKLGHNITIKSKNSLHLPEPSDNISAPGEDWDNKDGDSNDSKSNKIKITEVTDDQDDQESNDEQSAILESPQNSDDEHFTQEDENDFDDHISSNTIIKPNPTTKSHSLNQLKNLSKNITVKSLNQNTNQGNVKVTSHENNKNNDDVEENLTKQIVCRPPNKDMTQKTIAVNNRSNSVNKVTTSVKTFETETVIEEITTTVTKTVRTVNKTLNQECNANKIVSTNPTQNRILQNIRPVMQPRNLVRPPIRPSTSNIRPRVRNEASVSNQLVTNKCNINLPRAKGPRMQNKVPAIQNRVSNNSLKVHPNVNLNPTVKRRAPEAASGHFSQFKKPKESLIPCDNIEHSDNSEQFSSTSHQVETNFSSTNIVKGNSSVSQMKNKAISMSSQHLSKLGNASGIKVTKSSQSQKSTFSVVRNEVSPEKKSALDAIQKLQKQGLIIKKPRTEEDNTESEYSDFDET